MSSDGGEETLLQSSGDICAKSWSSDGRYLAYETLAASATTKSDIWILPLFGDRKPFPFLATQFDELAPQFSPDGRWILYTSDESGKTELYAAPFPGPGSRWQISEGEPGAATGSGAAGRLPLTLDRKQVSVQVKADASGFETGLPRVLFAANSADFFRSDPSGERELMAVPPETAQSTPINLISNWPAALKK